MDVAGAGETDEDRHVGDGCVERLAKEITVLLEGKTVGTEDHEDCPLVETEAAKFVHESLEQGVDHLHPGGIPRAGPLEITLVEIDRLVRYARGEHLLDTFGHAFGLTPSLEQQMYLFKRRARPPAEDQQEILVGVGAHPLGGRVTGRRSCLIGVETLGEAVIAAAGRTLHESGCAVACCSQDLGEGHGLVREVIPRHP